MAEMAHKSKGRQAASAEPFRGPFPNRGAVEALRDRVILDLRRRAPSPGTPFLTDAELASQSGLSRSTIRRALGELQKDGWLSREVGRGTFVGPRVSQADFDAAESRVGSLRVGVVLFDIGDLSSDWVTPQVMSGIDAEAAGLDITVELMGLREVDGSSLSRRLERSRPDVLVSLAARPRDALFLRDAIRLDIPTLVVGTAHQYLGLPAVVEDNRQGMNLAVDMLRDAGHERIGLILNRWPGAWVFERQEAFEVRMIEDGLDPFDVDTCWIGASDHPGHEDQWRTEPNAPHRHSLAGGMSFPSNELPYAGSLDRVCGWLERKKPTAVVAGSYSSLGLVGEAARKLGLSIPSDLSVAGMDQHPKASGWLGVEPSLAELPLREMGRQVALTSRALSEGATLPGVVLVPFTTTRGASVAPRK